jgi:predicted metal-dependent phosphoesterase TrpH
VSLDLHLHSTVSDGRLTPTELVKLAHAQGVKVMALTDHDSTDGVTEAISAGTRLGIRVVPGIELSTDVPTASIHVLGLFLAYEQPGFQAMVQRFREARLERAQRMVDALGALQAPVRLERVLEIAGEGSVGRPHIAQALLEAGHVDSIGQAFERYLNRDGPAYFEGFRLEPAEAVRLIHSVAGLASWAHPYQMDGRDWRTYLPLMLDADIDGIEAYYGKPYPPEAVDALLETCTEHNLVPTVGSDFHGFASMDALPGSVASPPGLLERLEARIAG